MRMRVERIASVVFAGLAIAAPAVAQGRCPEARDLRLINGRIHTLDARNTIASEVTIQDGKFTAVGRGAGNLDPCTRTIDLGGRTVVPGLIDNHNHIVLLGMRPFPLVNGSRPWAAGIRSSLP